MSKQVTESDTDYEKLKQDVRAFYSKGDYVISPVLNAEIHFTPEGFKHLVYESGRIERDRLEQMLRFRLLPLAIRLVSKATTYQEYKEFRKGYPVESANGRIIKNKTIRFWGIVGIIDDQKIKVIIKQIGDYGMFHFWSVMPVWVTNQYRDGHAFTTIECNPIED